MRQLSLGAALNEEVEIAPGTVPQAQGEYGTEKVHRDVEDRPEDRRIGNEAKASVK